ncbi:unnamed protein product [Adineta steineri]|uniref:SGNH hydrolase-type esterase domain-containing protein n=1 Tax=Adineta steineri TaxID=433720 RepID=A0A819INT3_9BILA|nr:unnamed protein product [Adineta steineri]
MNNQPSSSMNFLVLSDSHGKYLSLRDTASYNVVTHAIPGLRWFSDRERYLCASTLLSSVEFQPYLLQANAIFFLIGTNSVREKEAREIIPQIQQLIFDLRQKFPHFSEREKITIALCFPCFREIRQFRKLFNLMFNINLYNEQLKILSDQINFNVIDLRITGNHIADDIHVHRHFNYIIRNTIIDHFNELVERSSINSTVSISTSKPSQSSFRSQESNTLRIKKHNEKRKLKRQQYTIKRKLYNEWNLETIKKYLDKLKIRYAHIPRYYDYTLRIQFNNQDDHDLADNKLPIDIFTEKNYKTFINNESS